MDGTSKANFGYETWSRDSEFIYFDTLGADPRPSGCGFVYRKVERIFGLWDVPRDVGRFGPWTGLAPDGSPISSLL
ncbi:MAG: hypothetical protein ACJ74Z_22920 [Bryobacteraceae bacterium]